MEAPAGATTAGLEADTARDQANGVADEATPAPLQTWTSEVILAHGSSFYVEHDPSDPDAKFTLWRATNGAAMPRMRGSQHVMLPEGCPVLGTLTSVPGPDVPYVQDYIHLANASIARWQSKRINKDKVADMYQLSRAYAVAARKELILEAQEQNLDIKDPTSADKLTAIWEAQASVQWSLAQLRHDIWERGEVEDLGQEPPMPEPEPDESDDPEDGGAAIDVTME